MKKRIFAAFVIWLVSGIVTAYLGFVSFQQAIGLIGIMSRTGFEDLALLLNFAEFGVMNGMDVSVAFFLLSLAWLTYFVVTKADDPEISAFYYGVTTAATGVPMALLFGYLSLQHMAWARNLLPNALPYESMTQAFGSAGLVGMFSQYWEFLKAAMQFNMNNGYPVAYFMILFGLMAVFTYNLHMAVSKLPDMQ